MAIIGTFTQQNEQFTGLLVTLTLRTNLDFKPNTLASENAPAFRALAGEVEIGAAWRKQSKDGNVYYLVKLDDPAFSAPIAARLVNSRDGWRLLWSR